MWKLLVWCYRNQMVQYEVDRIESRTCSFAEELMASAGHASDRGCINGAGTTAHDDAHIVHRHVLTLAPTVHHLVVKTAAKGIQPDWNPAIVPYRVVPVWKGQAGRIERIDGKLQVFGRLRYIYGKSHRPTACMIDYEGVADIEAEAICEGARWWYAEWWKAVRILKARMLFERHLTLWKVTEIGAPREPWKNNRLTAGGI